MSSALLQLKIDPVLKDELKAVADYKGIPVSALAKMFLKEKIRQEKRQMLTENGMTEAEELEILRRSDEVRAGINTAGPFDSMDEMIADLNK